MGFSADYGSIPQGGGGLVPPGKYECIITNAEIRQTKNGKHKVSLMLTIRNDVQQNCQNRVLFIDIWRRREPTAADAQVDGFNFAQLMAVSRAAGIPSGQSFESLEQFLRALCGRCMIAAVKHETYNGETSARADAFGTEPTKFPDCRHVQKPRTAPASGSPAYGAPRPQAAPPAPMNIDPTEFEEILSDGDVPF